MSGNMHPRQPIFNEVRSLLVAGQANGIVVIACYLKNVGFYIHQLFLVLIQLPVIASISRATIAILVAALSFVQNLYVTKS